MPEDDSCCAPSRPGGASSVDDHPVTGGGTHTVAQCPVSAQTFAIGDSHGDGKPGDGERPVHAVSVSAFSIDATSGFRTLALEVAR